MLCRDFKFKVRIFPQKTILFSTDKTPRVIPACRLIVLLIHICIHVTCVTIFHTHFCWFSKSLLLQYGERPVDPFKIVCNLYVRRINQFIHTFYLCFEQDNLWERQKVYKNDDDDTSNRKSSTCIVRMNQHYMFTICNIDVSSVEASGDVLQCSAGASPIYHLLVCKD